MVFWLFFYFICPLTCYSFELELHTLPNFEVEFNASCPNYFTLHGDGNYMLLYQENGQIQFVMINNASIEWYVSPWSEIFVFSWPEILINDKNNGACQS